MLRALILGGAIWAAGWGDASACLAYRYFQAIAFFDTTPQDLAPGEIALDVSFDGSEEATLNGVVTARVWRVLHGAYSGDTIRVGLGNSSCTHSFVLGRKGIIVGRLVTPAQGEEIARGWPTFGGTLPGSERLRFSWPFQETALVPREETVEAYAQRNGLDAGRWYHRAHLGAAPRSRIAGDFDGDGRKDVVRLRSAGTEVALEVDLTSQSQPTLVVWPVETEGETLDLSTARPGVYATLCAIYWECERGRRAKVSFDHDAIILTDGAGDVLFFWNGSGFDSERIDPHPL